MYGVELMYFEICVPARITFSDVDEAVKFINNNLKVTSLYTTVYKFTKLNELGKIIYNTGIIDKLFFDFDSKKQDFLEHTKKLCKHFLNNNIKHVNYLSGSGFHILPSVEVKELRNKKAAIFNAQKHFGNLLKITLDSQTIGRTDQERRIPNSYNFKAHRWCVPVTCDELQSLNLEQLYALGERQRFNINNISGEELLDITKFDREIITREQIDLYMREIDVSIGENDILFINGTDKQIEIPPFIKSIMDVSRQEWLYEVGHSNRAIVMLWLFYNGLDLNEVLNVMRECLTQGEFKHMMKQGGSYGSQAHYIYSRLAKNNSTNPLFFPNISTLIAKSYTLNSKDVAMIEDLKNREKEVISFV